jgi:ribose transport system ATP-binding protein
MRGVRKAFGATVALAGVDFAVQAGEIHALVGENGAGKSTLMKVLSGALRPDAGEMLLDGQPYRPRDPHASRLAGVAMIYQELSLAPHLNVVENIWLGVERSRTEMWRGAADALAQLGHGDLPLNIRVGQLPVAQQQIVELARAVATGCRVLVLDEPTSSLAGNDVERLFALLRRLREQGHAIVYISHFLEEVRTIADRYTVLRDGRSVGGGNIAEATTASIVALMVGREVRDLYPRSPRVAGEPVLPVAGTTLHRSEVLGIAGLVGAGRTELLHSLFAQRRWTGGVGFVSEDRKTEGLATGLSVTDNLTLPRIPAWFRPTTQERTAQHWVERLAIRCRSPRQRVAELSGGNQQKVALARLLHADVDVWLLDEPTRGIDVGSKAEIYRLIDTLAGKGKAVLLVSSYLPELLGVCDRIAVMRRGQLGTARPVNEWDEQKLMTEATGTE